MSKNRNRSNSTSLSVDDSPSVADGTELLPETTDAASGTELLTDPAPVFSTDAGTTLSELALVHGEDPVVPAEEPVVKKDEPSSYTQPTITEEPVATMPSPNPSTEVKRPALPNTAHAVSAVAPKKTLASKFTAKANEYINYTKDGLDTPEKKKQASIMLVDLCHLVTTSHDRSIFEACFSFMLKNRALLLSSQALLAGLNEQTDKSKYTRVVQFYVIFASLVESKLLKRRYTININHVRDIFNNKQLADWLTEKR